MQRYLLRFAYDGTPFIGSQIQTKRIPPHEWTESYIATNRKTVQGAIELAFLQLQPANEPRLQLSSRTDTGVHALSSTAVIDLQRITYSKDNEAYFPPRYITRKLNKYFESAKLDIRISKTLAVDSSFSVRRALNRTYLYRYAIRKDDEKYNFPTSYAHELLEYETKTERKRRIRRFKELNISRILPFPDNKYIAEISYPICMDKTREVLDMFEGTHNFASFALSKASRVYVKRDSDSQLKIEMIRDPDFFTRTIEKIELLKVPPPLDPSIFPVYDAFDFYAAKFTGKAFFHNQIRRLMGLAFAVGRGSLDIQTIADKLKNPILPETETRTDFKCGMADPSGLHLLDVSYSAEDLLSSTDNLDSLPVGNPTEYPSPMIDWSKMGKTLMMTRPRYLLETSHRREEKTELE